MKLTKFIPAVGIAALLVAAGAASPASAATTSVSGTLVCPVGQTLYVHVVSEYASSKIFWIGGNKRYTGPVVSDEFYNYGTRGGNWQVTDATGNILTVSDGCQSGFTPVTTTK